MTDDEYVIDFHNLEDVFDDLRDANELEYGAIQSSLYLALEDDIRTGGPDAMQVARYLEDGDIDEAEELTYDILEE
jgi:hypothetical protein